MTARRIAIAAFYIGLSPLLVAPFAVICGFGYVYEAITSYQGQMSIPLDWGIGGVLYCLGLPIWLGYLWAARRNRTANQLKLFWATSVGLNTVWVVFFLMTLHRPERLSSPASLWLIYGFFPAVLLALSLMGLGAAQNR